VINGTQYIEIWDVIIVHPEEVVPLQVARATVHA